MEGPIAVEPNNDAVLVVGAGIAGMSAAMHLATLGHAVHLLDTAPAIGGSMHLLDHTFPTNSCGICLMLPRQPALCPTLECQNHDRIRLLPYAEVTRLTGQPGAFTAVVRHKARYVDLDRCNGCGQCAAVCPEARPHDHEGWLAPVKAIYRPAGLRAVPDAWVIDMNYCTRCGRCVAACPTAAIDLDMQPREEALAAGAVLLTPGFSPFDARIKGEYGYRVYDNVLSALEFERMVSLAGSSVARLARPSDARPPRRVAFVHCVGSRDNLCGAGHCSSACCMYTAKQVALAKKLDPALDVTVFYMDLRAFGKDFETYVAGVQALPGVTYRRAMPSTVHQQQATRDLVTTYASEDGKLREETFDMIVLAIGFAPPAGMQALARELGVELNTYGFAAGGQTDGYHPARTNRPGMFVAGAFREPKDIPETVAEAAGAAAETAAFLRAVSSRHRDAGPRAPSGAGVGETRSAASPASLRDVSDEEPRVGVFVCDCNGELSPVGVPQVVEWAAGLPGVAVALAVPLGCSADGQAAIRATIQAQKLNRVVVAGCTHRLYADEFDRLMQEVGLDRRLLARVNLREQVVYPHTTAGQPTVASKAKSLVGMAVAGLRTMSGLEALASATPQALSRGAAVIGGGAAGLSAALQLAGLGIPVDLVEREAELGGQWRHVHYQPDGSDPQAALRELLAQVAAEPGIRVHLSTELRALAGSPGNYRALLATNGRACATPEGARGQAPEGTHEGVPLRGQAGAGSQEETVSVGALVIATGGRPATPTEYLYGQHPRVLTQRELEERLAASSLQPDASQLRTVVMIQCVGSREPGRPYCSRICCTQAIKNALKLKELNPGLNVYVLYREVRTYGFREAYYQAARDAGVVFLRYEVPDKPQVASHEGALRVALKEPVTGQAMELRPDLLVLSVGIDASHEGALAQALGAKLNGDGFFQEEHSKMKPLDLGRGLFVAGLAHSPRFLEETIAQAQGAAMRAAAFLAPELLSEQPTSVWVNDRLCSFCGLCVEACPYAARVMNDDRRVAEVNYALCQGCGVCAVVCPNKATKQKAYEHKQLMASLDMALE